MVITEDIFAEFKTGRLESFYQKLYGGLLLYASRQLEPNFSFLAEDCVQDAIYKAYQQRATFAFPSVLKSFLYSCIHNSAMDILRKNQAQENYVSQQEERENLLDSIIEQETLDLVCDTIAELPDKYRKIFELSFREGLKNAEIAALLGVTESAVKKQKAQLFDRARQILRRKTGDDTLALLILLRLLFP